MRESEVENYLIKRVREYNGIVRKVQWIGRRNAPDRLVGFPGKGLHFLVELKRPGKKPTRSQSLEHQMLRAMGFLVWSLDTKNKVDKFIEYFTK